jgi:hypothetical protein
MLKQCALSRSRYQRLLRCLIYKDSGTLEFHRRIFIHCSSPINQTYIVAWGYAYATAVLPRWTILPSQTLSCAIACIQYSNQTSHHTFPDRRQRVSRMPVSFRATSATGHPTYQNFFKLSKNTVAADHPLDWFCTPNIRDTLHTASRSITNSSSYCSLRVPIVAHAHGKQSFDPIPRLQRSRSGKFLTGSSMLRVLPS